MNEIPKEFYARFAAHNRHVLLSTFVSLLAALITCALVYGFSAMVMMTASTIIDGVGSRGLPEWFHPAVASIIVATVVWAALDQRVRRYQAVPERSIIGWHVVGELVLIPARLLLSVWEQLGAFLWLSAETKQDAWQLLCHIYESRKAKLSSLGYVESDPERLSRLLYLLQLTQWIDLHRGGDQDWFYSICDSQRNILVILLNEKQLPENHEARI